MCDGRVIDRDPERLGELYGWQLPQASEQTVRVTAREENRITLGDPDERPREHGKLALLLACTHDRELRLATVARRDASRCDRAHEAARIARRADRRAELHEPLVEIARRVVVGQRGHELARARPQRASPRGGLDVVGDAEHASEDTRDVPVDERRALAERDARDGACRVWPDARHLA